VTAQQRERCLEERRGLRHPTRVEPRRAAPREPRRQLDGIGGARACLQREQPAEEPPRLGRILGCEQEVGGRGAHVRMPVAEERAQLRERRVEQWTRRALAAERRHAERVAAGMTARVPALDDGGEDAQHLLRGGPLALGAVALVREPARFDGGRRPRAGEQQDEGEDARHERTVARHEPSQAVSHRVGTRAHGAAGEPSLHILAQRGGGVISPLRLAAERHDDDAIEVAADSPRHGRRGGHGARRRRGLVEDRALDRGDRAPRGGEGARAGEQLEEEHAERPDVGSRRRRLSPELLGRRVLGRQQAQRGRRLERERGVGRCVQQLGDPEIEEPRRPVRLDEDVGRLGVAMHDEPAVREVHGVGDAQEEGEPVADRERPMVAVGGDRHALDELQHEERAPVGSRVTPVRSRRR
jgi:hypothetical protein